MPEVISFEKAIERTDKQDRALLIGNGFSIQYFDYKNLLAESGLEADRPVRKLFDTLDTVDFERVIFALEAAAWVEITYGNDAHASDLLADAETVREALVKAVQEIHPDYRDKMEPKFPSSAAFLKRFSKVFTLNYD